MHDATDTPSPPWRLPDGSVPASSLQSGPAPVAPPRGEPGAERYQVGNVLGEGGMGRVSVAQDAHLGRDVALKELHPSLRHRPDAAARLQHEAWITAQLDHPGVVAVHDAGQLGDGRPFYTMRLVRGRTLAAALAEAEDLSARLRLMRPLLAVCEAVAYAHACGVVHRDLKSSNVLLGGFGETQVVDWGLAVRVGAPGGEGPVGTPSTMSPEQAAGAQADPRADVWSLGAMLCELLTGAPPYGALDQDATLAALRVGPPPPMLSPPAPPELAAITARALAWRPEDRYPDAGALAQELGRWFEGRRVLAYHYSPWELLRRVLSAWRVPVAVGAVGAALFGLSVAVGFARTEAARERAEHAEAQALEALDTAERRLAALQVEQALTAAQRGQRAEAETLAALALSVAEDPLARGVLAGFGRAPRPTRLAVEESPACLWRQLRDDGGAMLCGEAKGTSLWTLSPLTRVWRSEAVGVGGGLSAAGALLWDMNHHLTILGLSDGAPTRSLPLSNMSQRPTSGQRHMLSPKRRVWPDDTPEGAQGVCPAGVQAATMAEDGARVALVCLGGVVAVGPPDGPMRALGTPLGERLGATALRFTPDGEALIIGGEGGVLRALDLQTGLERQHIQTSLGAIRRLQISQDGAMVAALGVRGGVGLWSLAAGAWLGELPAPRDADVALLPDGALVAGDTLTRWSLTGLERPIRVLASAGLSELGISPDGAALALAQGDGQVRVVDLHDGRPLGVVRAGRGVVKGVGFSPGALWASVMDGAGLVGWSWPSLAPLPTPPGSRTLRRLTTAGAGALWGVDFGSSLFAWDTLTEEPAVLDVGGPYLDMERGPGGVITLSAAGQARLVPERGAPRHLAQLDGAFAVALSAEVWAWAGDDGVTLLALNGAWTRALPAPGARPRDLTFSPDGALVAAAGIDGRARVWSVEDGVLLGLLAGHEDRIPALEFTPDGQALVTVSWDSSARLWSVPVLRQDRASLTAEVLAAWRDPSQELNARVRLPTSP
jgi:hypothetical protein